MRKRADAFVAAAVFVAAFILYLLTLAPSAVEMFDDSLELQLVAYQLGIAHPTGYPLYTLVGKLFTLLPAGDPAYRVNLMSAFWGAAAVSLLYWVARQTCRQDYRRVSGAMPDLSIPASATSALFFATAPVLWSNATVAEVYTLNLFFMGLTLALALNAGRSPSARSWRLFALAVGLSLTHHRTILLLAPAFVAYFVLISKTAKSLTWPAIGRRNGLSFAALLLLPLALYLYIPIRAGSVGSLDGNYENTLSGFLQWTTASSYGAFFTANPWGFTDNPAMGYWRALVDQFSWPGIALSFAGILWLLRQFRLWLLFMAGLATTVAFSLTYRVADPEPFYLPSFFFFAIFLAAGIVSVLEVGARISHGLLKFPSPIAFGRSFGLFPTRAGHESRSGRPSVAATRQWGGHVLRWKDAPMTLFRQTQPLRLNPGYLHNPGRFAVPLVALVLLLAPASRVAADFAAHDRSREDTVLNYGLDVLSQPIEDGSAIVGIGGEMTLLKYLQATRSLRPDLVFATADEQKQRLEEITKRVESGQGVYTTRALAGLAERYSLRSTGPLILVAPQTAGDIPVSINRVAERLGSSIELAGYRIEPAKDGYIAVRGSEPGKAKPTVRITLFWRALDKVFDDFTVFIHIEDETGRLIGQKDRRPVNGAYPTTTWRKGELIADTYDIPLLIGTPPGIYQIGIGLYNPNGRRLTTASGANQLIAGQLQLANSVPRPAASALDVERREARWGDNLELLGYRIGSPAARPGDTVDVDLLWQARDPAEDVDVSLLLTDQKGQRLVLNTAKPTSGSYPMTRWAKGETVRDMRRMTIPADLADGVYQLAVLPDSGDKPAALTSIEVRGRSRLFELPAIRQLIDASFAQGITLLGYDLKEGSRRLGLNLYWQSRGKIDASYKVFVHVVGEDGKPVAQHDSLPQQGIAPTLSWVAGEIISDGHELELPPVMSTGEYRLLVGLYDPLSGRRLAGAGGDSVEVMRWMVR